MSARVPFGHYADGSTLNTTTGLWGVKNVVGAPTAFSQLVTAVQGLNTPLLDITADNVGTSPAVLPVTSLFDRAFLGTAQTGRFCIQQSYNGTFPLVDTQISPPSTSSIFGLVSPAQSGTIILTDINNPEFIVALENPNVTENCVVFQQLVGQNTGAGIGGPLTVVKVVLTPGTGINFILNLNPSGHADVDLMWFIVHY